jgi:LPXTG-motif cell wall-anchored protein
MEARRKIAVVRSLASAATAAGLVFASWSLPANAASDTYHGIDVSKMSRDSAVLSAPTMPTRLPNSDFFSPREEKGKEDDRLQKSGASNTNGTKQGKNAASGASGTNGTKEGRNAGNNDNNNGNNNNGTGASKTNGTKEGRNAATGASKTNGTKEGRNVATGASKTNGTAEGRNAATGASKTNGTKEGRNAGNNDNNNNNGTGASKTNGTKEGRNAATGASKTNGTQEGRNAATGASKTNGTQEGNAGTTGAVQGSQNNGGTSTAGSPTTMTAVMPVGPSAAEVAANNANAPAANNVLGVQTPPMVNGTQTLPGAVNQQANGVVAGVQSLPSTSTAAAANLAGAGLALIASGGSILVIKRRRK